MANEFDLSEFEVLQNEFRLVGLALAGCVEPGCEISEEDITVVCHAFQDLRKNFNNLVKQLNHLEVVSHE